MSDPFHADTVNDLSSSDLSICQMNFWDGPTRPPLHSDPQHQNLRPLSAPDLWRTESLSFVVILEFPKMADPLEPQQQPQQQPPLVVPVTQQAYSSHTNHGSVGALIAVLAVITVLGAIAVMIGRLCSGRKVMGHGQYDFEGWVERKCASCIDGRIDPPRPPPSLPLDTNSSHNSNTVASPLDIREEPIQIDHSTQENPPASTTQ
ncbi:hypothetical protein IFM89_010041 [Coptis chinensis]|uniref:Uncharacterized protein n=1 Tax=Coptis chinensis TaxID=261450 RepID=A0A835HJQ4_9MAGN|nr:hypothetical protein IFM89_010041 [Coptis chinensis]